MGDYNTTATTASSSRSVESVSDILDGRLFISNLQASQNPTLLTRLGITHIISVCPPSTDTAPTHDLIDAEHRLRIPVQDNEYAEILGYLPSACTFIERALGENTANRVLVHCVMGVSRSATVVAAYLMKTRNITHTEAIAFVRSRRPIVHPNYGFRLQLAAFSACSFTPTPTHPAYIAWKRKSKRVLRKYVGIVQDTVEVVSGEVFVCSELPTDPEQAESLLYDHSITHVLALSGVEQIKCPVDVLQARLDALLASFSGCSSSQPVDSLVGEGMRKLDKASGYVRDVVRKGGQVMVYGESEMVGCVVLCAYLMSYKNMSIDDATRCLRQAMPLFHPTSTFERVLNAFDAHQASRSSRRPALPSTTAISPAPSTSTSISIPTTVDVHPASPGTSSDASLPVSASAPSISGFVHSPFKRVAPTPSQPGSGQALEARPQRPQYTRQLSAGDTVPRTRLQPFISNSNSPHFSSTTVLSTSTSTPVSTIVRPISTTKKHTLRSSLDLSVPVLLDPELNRRVRSLTESLIPPAPSLVGKARPMAHGHGRGHGHGHGGRGRDVIGAA